MSNKAKNILFRSDSSSSMGVGHLMRNLVLASKYKNDNIYFACKDLVGNSNHKILEAGYILKILKSNELKELDKLIKSLNIDLLIIDSYDIDWTFEKSIKEKNTKLKLLSFDDTYKKHYCDILLNHNIYAEESKYQNLVPFFCELRCGEKYTLFREEFYEQKDKLYKKNKNVRIFLALGGTDIKQLNLSILELLKKMKLKVDLITSSSNKQLEKLKRYSEENDFVKLHIDTKNIAKLMKKSDLGIITASVTANEMYFLKKDFIAIKVAKNQQFMYEFLKNKKYFVLDLTSKECI